MDTVEWSIMRRFDPVTPTLHCGPMSFDEAMTWLKEWDDDGGKPGAFTLAFREVGPWVVSPAQVTERMRPR